MVIYLYVQRVGQILPRATSYEEKKKKKKKELHSMAGLFRLVHDLEEVKME